jgi:hypothetical protein
MASPDIEPLLRGGMFVQCVCARARVRACVCEREKIAYVIKTACLNLSSLSLFRRCMYNHFSWFSLRCCQYLRLHKVDWYAELERIWVEGV